jgi:hypothetical protein
MLLPLPAQDISNAGDGRYRIIGILQGGGSCAGKLVLLGSALSVGRQGYIGLRGRVFDTSSSVSKRMCPDVLVTLKIENALWDGRSQS